jgi:Ca-activated chloride channel family protein
MRQNLNLHLSAAFLLLLSLSNAFGQQTKPAPPKQTPDEQDEVLRVDTELVSVPAIVTDKTGKPVSKLNTKNFLILEDGKPQEIENFQTTEAPFEIALLLDTSGSTRSELSLITRAADAFIKALRPGDKVAIIAFKIEKVEGRSESVVDILSDLTDDRAALADALGKTRTSNGTPFYDALETIGEKIFANKPRAEQRGRRAIVALTDGVDSTSAIEFADARERIQAVDLACYFVQLNTEDSVENSILGDCDDETATRFSKTQLRRYQKMLRPRPGAPKPIIEDFCDLGQFERLSISRTLYKVARSEMERLAAETGGKTFPVAELREAKAAFAEVAQEIGTQYSLGYYSNNQKRDGTFRKIQVQLRGLPAGTQIKTRDGYTAGKD